MALAASCFALSDRIPFDPSAFYSSRLRRPVIAADSLEQQCCGCAAHLLHVHICGGQPLSGRIGKSSSLVAETGDAEIVRNRQARGLHREDGAERVIITETKRGCR